jgi:hypothetical protein
MLACMLYKVLDIFDHPALDDACAFKAAPSVMRNCSIQLLLGHMCHRLRGLFGPDLERLPATAIASSNNAVH